MSTKLVVWCVFIFSTGCLRVAKIQETNPEELEFESSNVGQQAVFRREGLPRTVIQFGTPRTAIAFEFQTLCAVMSVLHTSEPKPVLCTYKEKLTYVLEPRKVSCPEDPSKCVGLASQHGRRYDVGVRHDGRDR